MNRNANRWQVRSTQWSRANGGITRRRGRDHDREPANVHSLVGNAQGDFAGDLDVKPAKLSAQPRAHLTAVEVVRAFEVIGDANLARSEERRVGKECRL